MLATLPSQAPSLTDKAYVYEPKVDGIRAIVEVLPRLREDASAGKPGSRRPPCVSGRATATKRPRSSLTSSTPIARVAEEDHVADRPRWRDRRARRGHAAGGFPAAATSHSRHRPRFQLEEAILPPDQQPAAFIAFDLLRDGDDDLRSLPLTERRKRLESLFERHKTPASELVRLTPQSVGDGNGAHETGERGKLGGLDGQARPLAVSHREAQSRVDQAQAEQAGRVCRCRLDRTRRHSRALRIADPRRARQWLGFDTPAKSEPDSKPRSSSA